MMCDEGWGQKQQAQVCLHPSKIHLCVLFDVDDWPFKDTQPVC